MLLGSWSIDWGGFERGERAVDGYVVAHGPVVGRPAATAAADCAG